MSSAITYEVTLTQHGNGLYSRSFTIKEQAIAFAESEWNANKSDPDFMRGRDERAEWKVWECRSEDDQRCIWIKQADQ